MSKTTHRIDPEIIELLVGLAMLVLFSFVLVVAQQ